MKTFCLLFILVMTTGRGIALEAHNYNQTISFGYAKINGTPIRYVVFFPSPCIFIQQVRVGGGGAIDSEVKICSYREKDFEIEYSSVEILKSESSDDKLILIMAFRHFGTEKKTIAECELLKGAEARYYLECSEEVPETMFFEGAG